MSSELCISLFGFVTIVIWIALSVVFVAAHPNIFTFSTAQLDILNFIVWLIECIKITLKEPYSIIQVVTESQMNMEFLCLC